MVFTYRDANRLRSMGSYDQRLLNKKRRWLQGTPTTSLLRESKRRKSLTRRFLTESYVRSDEVSAETIRTNVEKSFGSFSDSQGRHHVVQENLQLLDIGNLESQSVDTSNFLKKIYSEMDLLNNGALFLVANLVTDKKVKFEKVRPRMNEIIRDYLRKILVESNYRNGPIPYKQIAKIFKDPSNFREKQLTLRTPVSSPLLSTIHNTLEGLDEMPLLDLVVVNRKLRGGTVIPQFPPILNACKRDLLITRVRKRCKKFLLALREGDELPEPFAKALSVMRLSLKQKTRCVDISTSEFYLFSPKIVYVQNDILKALWSLPNFRIKELKALHPLVDPEAKVSMRSFRSSLRNYLMQYLFECDAIEIPDKVLSVLAFLNRRSRRRPVLFSSEKMIDEEVESVLNVSGLLTQVVLNPLPQTGEMSETSEPLGYNDGNENNDFQLDETDYCATSGEHRQIDSSCLNEDVGTTGNSWTAAHRAPKINNQSNCLQVTDAYEAGCFIKNPKLEEEDFSPALNNKSCPLDNMEDHTDDCISRNCKLEQDDMNPSKHFCKEEIDLEPGHTVQEIARIRETLIQEICDETSLVAYKLIGCMLDNLMHEEGRDVDEMSRYYLLGGSSLPHSQGAEDSSAAKEEGAEVLLQAVEKLLPSMPKSCTERTKILMSHPEI
ncbi:uncharacterized protein M6B38_338985 [Iris pallida]|uniref:Uncharacterized protein n=1 Tax=Iris pallida TaxID=29817 RepID=A0AAX6GYH0_IRIPA|nr:uncharacterized protein M6B38_338985 [Iris pallida]